MQLDNLGVVGPGKWLQQARVNKNLRPEDVAIELRLTTAQVLALEEDDYSRMPELTYVRGYVRNYARLVGVAEDQVLVAFARLTRKEDHTHRPLSPAREREIHSPGKGILIAVLLLLLVVAGSAVFWYLNQPEAESEPVAAAPGTVTIDEVPTGISTITLSTDEEGATDTAAAEDNAATDTAEEAAAGAVPAATVTDPATVTATDRAAVMESPVAADPVTESATPPPGDPTVATTGSRLKMVFSKDCWTDIRDATGKKLVYRTVPQGQTLELDGQAPFTLFFGFAQGVSLSFDGEAIDLAPHTRGVFARLTLGD